MNLLLDVYPAAVIIAAIIIYIWVWGYEHEE